MCAPTSSISETAHYADLILPDASYMERWGFDTRNNMELRDYVTLRQPMVDAAAGPMRELCDVTDRTRQAHFIRKSRSTSPSRTMKTGCASAVRRLEASSSARRPASEDGLGDADKAFAYMRRHGVYQDMEQPMYDRSTSGR